jgi:HTH-type transcriptional regulator, transcriptional repressor of NAD biosynthesis genes
MVTSIGENIVFSKGFVFGKFYPLHKGHLEMIHYAVRHCNHLTILVCCSDQEKIPPAIRVSWLREELLDYPSIQILEYYYDESLLPNTSVSDREVSRQWADVFQALLPDVDLLVTSELYGDYVAEFMGIKHLAFDPERKKQAISASLIREDAITFWHFLPDSVKRYFQKIIIISGTESTGKTTLAKNLSAKLPAVLVEEVGREKIQDSNCFTEEDLYAVAIAHAEAISIAKKQLQPLVIVDTDVYITQSYADFAWGKTLNLPHNIYMHNQPDLRLYLDASVPYFQDGGRLSEENRNQLDLYHRKTLSVFDQGYSEITGDDWGARSAAAECLVEGLFKNIMARLDN